jgi:hypothetical protein
MAAGLLLLLLLVVVGGARWNTCGAAAWRRSANLSAYGPYVGSRATHAKVH